MSINGEDDRAHITSGPRWDQVMPAVQESIRVVKKKGKGQGGWIKAMLDSYESIAEDLTKCGYVRREPSFIG